MRHPESRYTRVSSCASCPLAFRLLHTGLNGRVVCDQCTSGRQSDPTSSCFFCCFYRAMRHVLGCVSLTLLDVLLLWADRPPCCSHAVFPIGRTIHTHMLVVGGWQDPIPQNALFFPVILCLPPQLHRGRCYFCGSAVSVALLVDAGHAGEDLPHSTTWPTHTAASALRANSPTMTPRNTGYEST